MIAVLIAAFGTLALRYLPVLRVAENWLADLRIAHLTPFELQPDNLIILAITEETLATLDYRSPIDRGLLVDIVRELERRDAALIGIDLLFDQPTETRKDAAFFAALQDSSVPIVVAWAEARDGLTQGQIEHLENSLVGMRRGLTLVKKDRDDGKVRAVLLRRSRKGQETPGFATAMAEVLGAPVPRGRILDLRYRKGPHPETPAFKMYPAHLLSVLPRDWFTGRVVLLGTDLALEDRHTTPLSLWSKRTMPGVEIHAHALVQLLEDTPGYELHTRYLFFVLLACAVAGMATALSRLVMWQKGMVIVLATIIIWSGGFVLFLDQQALLPLILPTAALLFGAGIELGFSWQRESKQRQFVLNAFGKYLSPRIIDQLVADPSRLRLSGEKRDMTFLFTDVAGFVSLTEQTEPDQLVSILNRYFELLTTVVLNHEGTIDKIVGDALHVMFNAPLDQDDHAERAVRCALELDERCESFRATMSTENVAFGVTRIGINSGECIVGNVGGSDRFDYTGHGDPINTAARLEGANRYIGTRICVSESTANACDETLFRPIGGLILKGKAQPIRVYEPIARTDDRISAFLRAYLDAFELLDKDVESAKSAFEELYRGYPDDPLVSFHLLRLQAGAGGTVVELSGK